MGIRRAGILLHVTSLPGPYGIGDFGGAAYRFVDFLRRAGQSIWQILPLGPTGYGDSPYQSFSAFAGNPLLISPEHLLRDGLLTETDLTDASGLATEQFPTERFPADRVDFERVTPWRMALLERAFARFSADAPGDWRAEFNRFRASEARWLDDYTLYMALKESYPPGVWTDWAAGDRQRQPAALQARRQELAGRIELHAFAQFLFFRQWRELKQYANRQGVLVMGDIPIFVAHDSADVWAAQELFSLDAQGRPTLIAGVPPDYFCATGQRWGNPLYRWDRLAEQDYRWWTERLAAAMRTLDLIRIDHFRGFEAYWEIPASAPTAMTGRWVAGPGDDLFRAMTARLGPLPLIAEDLGVITPAVEALRDRLELPGMRVLQFAFGEDPKANDYQPHNYPRHCLVYTGTHDNDTSVGWHHSQAGEGTTRTADEIAAERDLALRYLHSDGREVHWDMIRAAHASVADVAIVPMQDVLGLGSEARMNMPGSSTGNWRWRMPAQPPRDLELRLAEMTGLYGRQV
jgi:4-alpha-glucanotransferase